MGQLTFAMLTKPLNDHIFFRQILNLKVVNHNVMGWLGYMQLGSTDSRYFPVILIWLINDKVYALTVDGVGRAIKELS